MKRLLCLFLFVSILLNLLKVNGAVPSVSGLQITDTGDEIELSWQIIGIDVIAADIRVSINPKPKNWNNEIRLIQFNNLKGVNGEIKSVSIAKTDLFIGHTNYFSVKMRGSNKLWGKNSLISILVTTSPTSGQITMTWDPNPETDIAGYRVYYGDVSRRYTNYIDTVEGVIQTIKNLEIGGTYFIAVTAVNLVDLESDYSNEYVAVISQRELNDYEVSMFGIFEESAGLYSDLYVEEVVFEYEYFENFISMIYSVNNQNPIVIETTEDEIGWNKLTEFTPFIGNNRFILPQLDPAIKYVRILQIQLIPN